MKTRLFFLPLILFLFVVPNLSAQMGELFHNGFEDDNDQTLANGSPGSDTEDPWDPGGYQVSPDVLTGLNTSDFLEFDRSCKLVKYSGSSSLYANVILDDGEQYELYVGMWFKMEEWDTYDVPIGSYTDIFSLWNEETGGEDKQAVRVMIAGDYERSLLVEFQIDGGTNSVILGTEEVEPFLEPGTDPVVSNYEESVFLDSNRWYYLELFYRSDEENGGVELRVDGGSRLYKFGMNTLGYQVDCMILGAKLYDDATSAMTLLFDDVDIWDTQRWQHALNDIHFRTHGDHSIPGSEIKMDVDFDMGLGNFNDNFRNRFLQMVAEPEGNVLDLLDYREEYKDMGMRGVRFVASGNECHYGNPHVLGTPGNFQYNFSHLDTLIVSVTHKIGAPLRLGVGKTNYVMQCFEGFEYPGPAGDLNDYWSVSNDFPDPPVISLTSKSYERANALLIKVPTGTSSDTVYRAFDPVDDPDRNWIGGNEGIFELLFRANEIGAKCKFFIRSNGGTAWASWNLEYNKTNASYQRATLDFTAPDDNSNWLSELRTNLATVDNFGLCDFEYSPPTLVKLNVDWMRIPGSGWFPYDQSRYNFQEDWWREYCDALFSRLGELSFHYDLTGLVIEGWNESDRMYTASGEDTLKDILLEIYKITATELKNHIDNNEFNNIIPQMASLSFSKPKEDDLIKEFLTKVKDETLAMDLFGTHSYKGAPNTVIDVVKYTRDILNTHENGYFSDKPIYLGAYMDFFNQDFRKDTNHRAAQWLMTMLKLEEANRDVVNPLNVWGVTTYGYKDFNVDEVLPGCDLWPSGENQDRRFFGAFGLLTNPRNWGAHPKAIAYAYELVSMMDTKQIDVQDVTNMQHPERQYWVKGIATKKWITPTSDDTVSLLLVNFDNALAVGEKFTEVVEVTFKNLPFDVIGPPPYQIHWTKYQIDQNNANLCYDGGWCERIGTGTPYVIRDITGTKDWKENELNGLKFVDAETTDEQVFTIDDTIAPDTLWLLETTPTVTTGIYHVENVDDAALNLDPVDDNILVDWDSVNKTLTRPVDMPLNSVVLIQIYQ